MKKNYQVTGMGCSACSARIENGVKKMNGIRFCQVNLLTNSMVVEFDENVTSSKQIMEKVEDLGYGAEEDAEEEEEKEVEEEQEEEFIEEIARICELNGLSTQL